MSKLLKTYTMTIETLTPVHIGTGTVLVNNFDFVVHGGKTYRLNLDRVLDYLWPADVDALSKDELEKLTKTPPGELLLRNPANLQRPELVMYVMEGVPRVKTAGAGQIREQIKDAYGRLYIPGSTIKGAIRTALARHLAKALNIAVYSHIAGREREKRETADDELDKALFRPKVDSANYDLLRALHIADSAPVSSPPMLANVQVFRAGKGQSPIEVEAIPAGVTFVTALSLDEYLLGKQAAVLGWKGDERKALRSFWVTCRNTAGQQIQREKGFFQKYQMATLLAVYQSLEKRLQGLKGGMGFLLRIGWAGGWENKTLGSDLLAGNTDAFRRLREQFGMGRPPGRKGAWTPGKEFPLSRRLLVNEQNMPTAPMGWVLVTLEEKR